MSKIIMLQKHVSSSFSSLRLCLKHVIAKPFCSKIEVNVISEEIIKPSSPTSPHLRTFKLSLLDQFAPLLYVPFVFFYPMNHDHPKTEERLSKIKESLSKTLTCFYPLAGRIKDHSSVDCNDEGALYMEARVSQEMFEFLRQPKIELLSHFLPCQLISTAPPESVAQVAVKANIFACGGIAIGICCFHKIVDGFVMTQLVKQWAAIARGDGDQEVYAHNMGASLFPLNELFLSQASRGRVSDLAKEGKSSTRRFVFDAAAISVLKAKAQSEQVPNPTRTEVLIALVWKSTMNAFKVLYGSQKPSAVLNGINLRPRLKSPLQEFSVGNIVWSGLAYCNPTSNEADMELHHLVDLLRKAVAKVDSDWVQKMQGEQGHVEISKRMEEMGEIYSTTRKPAVFGVSSLVKMGMYEVDFGWGKPAWISLVEFTEAMFNNSIVLMEASMGDGVEVWLTLDEHEMAILEQDLELLSYVTLNPSIISNTVSRSSKLVQNSQFS